MDKYVAIMDVSNDADELKHCIGVFDTYHEALGKAYQKINEYISTFSEESYSYNIDLPVWDKCGNDFMKIKFSCDGETHYAYVFYYGDKEDGRWD